MNPTCILQLACCCDIVRQSGISCWFCTVLLSYRTLHFRSECLVAACIEVVQMRHNQAKSEHVQLRDHFAPLQTVHSPSVLSTDVAAAPKFGAQIRLPLPCATVGHIMLCTANSTDTEV